MHFSFGKSWKFSLKRKYNNVANHHEMMPASVCSCSLERWVRLETSITLWIYLSIFTRASLLFSQKPNVQSNGCAVWSSAVLSTAKLHERQVFFHLPFLAILERQLAMRRRRPIIPLKIIRVLDVTATATRTTIKNREERKGWRKKKILAIEKIWIIVNTAFTILSDRFAQVCSQTK